MNRTVKLRVWCTNDESARWLFFRVGGEAADCDEIKGLCEVRRIFAAKLTARYKKSVLTTPNAWQCARLLFKLRNRKGLERPRNSECVHWDSDPVEESSADRGASVFLFEFAPSANV